MAKPKPKLANEANQMPAQDPNVDPKKAARRARKQAKRAANQQAKAGGGQATSTTQPLPGSTGMPTQESAEASDKWSTDVTTGQFETNPWLQAMMDPAKLDVRNNPNLQPVVDSVQREAGQDLLRSLWDKDAQAESKGRAGSGYSAALRVQESEQQNEAVADAISRIYAGAYENEANRQSGLMPSVLSTQASAARVPIEWDQNEINRQKSYWDYLINKGQLGVARGQLGLAKSEAGFQRKMALQAAQQNALDSYVDILRGIGGLGGTTVETTPGVYSPSMDPWAAALMGAGGGWMESYGQKGQVQA